MNEKFAKRACSSFAVSLEKSSPSQLSPNICFAFVKSLSLILSLSRLTANVSWLTALCQSNCSSVTITAKQRQSHDFVLVKLPVISQLWITTDSVQSLVLNTSDSALFNVNSKTKVIKANDEDTLSKSPSEKLSSAQFSSAQFSSVP